MTIRIYTATSRSGAVRERKTECEYTHAVDNGHEIVSFHMSYDAAVRAARGRQVVPVQLKKTWERNVRQAANDRQMPTVAAKFFAGKLHFGEEPGTIRVHQFFDPTFGEWDDVDVRPVITIKVAKEFRAAGITRLALKNDLHGTIADFTTEELMK